MESFLVDGSELPVLGVAILSVVINSQMASVELYVVQANILLIMGSDIMKYFSWAKLGVW